MGDLSPLASLFSAEGPIGLIALGTTGPAHSRAAEIFEAGALLLGGQGESPRTLESALRTRTPVPGWLLDSAGLAAEHVKSAPALSEWRGHFAKALAGRTLIAHAAEEVRRFLVRDCSAAFARTRFLDLDDLLALTHPDAREQDGRALMALVLGGSLRPRALGAARDALDVLVRVARGARAGEPRYENARRALERQCPDSCWLGLLGKSEGFGEEVPEVDQFVTIGSSGEEPVANDADAIARVLADGERGQRHFPGYRVREEQIEKVMEPSSSPRASSPTRPSSPTCSTASAGNRTATSLYSRGGPRPPRSTPSS